MSMWAVQADSAAQEAATTAAGRRARRAGGRGRVGGEEHVERDAEDGATDMRARYTLPLDLH